MNKPTLLAVAICFAPAAYAQNNQMISSGSQFNPAMSLILDGNYSHDNQKGLSGAALDGCSGHCVWPGDGEGQNRRQAAQLIHLWSELIKTW